MKEPILDSSTPFLQKYSAQLSKWNLLQGMIACLGVFLACFACFFLMGGKDGFAASSLALSFVCFFILYSLSFTMKELVLLKAMECKKEIEPLYDLAQKEALFQCVDEYYLLASQARKEAFHYESDSESSTIQTLINRIKRFFFWKEFHVLEEIALLGASDLLARQVRSTPCDIELHARLASTFILLQNHFLEPMKAKSLMKFPSLYITKHHEDIAREKAKKASCLAVEELEIMSSYAPDEIWVHEQLAISYRELNMQEKEINECEKLLLLSPDDPQVLLRLGTLYFHTGQNGKGLKMYETLKEIDPHLGQELISCYGSSIPFLQMQ